jgi:putative acyl-CoA dehydrogenase
VNSIWEGSGNIMCLDVLRAFGRSAATRDAVLQELEAARGLHRLFDAAFERFAASLGAAPPPEASARRFAQMFAVLMQASLLLRAAANAGASARASAGAAAVAEGFCATRLDFASGWGAVFGASDAALDAVAILRRAWPE